MTNKKRSVNSKKLLIILLLVFVLFIPLIKLPLVVNATIVFYSDFEEGDTSEWEGEDGTPSVQSGVVINGSYSLLLDTWNDAVYNSTSMTEICWDGYVSWSANPSGDLAISQTINSASSKGLQIYVYNDTGTTKWQIKTCKDNLDLNVDLLNSSYPDAGNTYHVQAYYKLSTVGGAKLFIDGSLVYTYNSTTGGQTVDLFSCGDGSNNYGNTYFDDVRITDEEPEESFKDYTFESSGGLYNVTENIEPYRTYSSASATTSCNELISYISNATDPEIEWVGDFTFSTQTDNWAYNCSMDFTQATVTGSVSGGIVADVTASISIYGGNWTGTESNNRLRFFTTEGNCTIDYTECVDFKWEFTQYCGTNMVVRNSYFHGLSSSSYYIASNNAGNNTFQNITFADEPNGSGGVYVKEDCEYCQFINCTFSNVGYHSIYLSSYTVEGASIGGHVVRDCTFEAFKNYNMAGVHLKCNATKIYNNIFRNFTDSWNNPAISMYSDFDYSNCHDNEIYNNTFMDMYEAIRIGSSLANVGMRDNKIYNNTFIDISSSTGVFTFGYGSVPEATQYINSTWIYYNHLVNCPSVFPTYPYDRSIIRDTVIAYNVFETEVPSDEVTLIKSWYNTMIYGNTGLDDWNEESPPSIPPPGDGETYYYLTVESPVGSGTVTPDVGEYAKIDGYNQTLTATASGGYGFVNFTVTFINTTVVELTEETSYLTIDQNVTVQAYFEELPDSYTLTLTVTSPANTTYTSHSIPVSLSTSGNDTNPAYSWNAKFTNGTWLYVSNQTSTSATITITENATDVLFACHVEGDNAAEDYEELYFSVSLSYYTLTVESATGGTTNPSEGTYYYYAAETETLTATPTGYYAFAAWEIDGVNETTTDRSYDVTMNADHTVKAHFQSYSELPSLSVSSLWTYLFEGDFVGFGYALLTSTFNFLSLGIAIVILMFLVPLYLRTGSLLLLCIAWLIIGGFLIVLIPEVAGLAILLIVLGVGGLVYRLFRPSSSY